MPIPDSNQSNERRAGTSPRELKRASALKRKRSAKSYNSGFQLPSHDLKEPISQSKECESTQSALERKAKSVQAFTIPHNVEGKYKRHAFELTKHQIVLKESLKKQNPPPTYFRLQNFLVWRAMENLFLCLQLPNDLFRRYNC